MLVQNVSNISLDTFREITVNKKVVIIYPRANYRNLFLAYFLADDAQSVLYYRVENDNTPVADFVRGLASEFAESVPGFGQQTQGRGANASPVELAEALANDLNSIPSNKRLTLYLDELDRVQLNNDYRSFLDALIQALSDNCQLVINARVLTLSPWNELVEQGAAAVLGTAYNRNQLIYTVDEEKRPQLEIYAFGRGHAVVNGLEIETWDGALPRNLFFYFVDNDLVTRDEIFNVFWPNLPVKEATNVFHVTKRKITERISINVYGGGNHELTNYGNGFYTPSDKLVRHYDVAEFIEAVDEAAMTFNDDEQAVLYERAVNAYRAPFLITVNMSWVHERREKLQRMFVEALIGLARIHKAGKRYEQALGYFIRTLRQEPQREDIYREIMTIYNIMGYRDEALRHYKMLESRLQDTLGVAPSQETRALYDQISAS